MIPHLEGEVDNMNEASSSLTAADRLVLVLDHLGLPKVHVGGRLPVEIVGLLERVPGRVASVVLQGANGRPEPFAPLGARALWLLGDAGPSAQMRPRLAATPNTVEWIVGYPEFLWSDTVADRTDEIARTMLKFLGTMDADSGVPAISLGGAGEVAGVTYSAAGSGSPVVLLPLGLSSKQWDPILPFLQASHCTVVLGGKYLAPVELLESRGESGYTRMALNLLDMANPRPGDSLIEVGCGTGTILRRIAEHPSMPHVTGIDINGFLLREARALAAHEGLSERILFDEGSAEALPYADDSFDIVYSSTVMEEVDADRMLGELVRVAKPGGRVAVAVRAVDRGQWTNLPLPAPLKDKVELPGGGPGVSKRGCADESLYRRFRQAGLIAIDGGPAWAWARPEDPWWLGNLQHQVRGALSQDEDRALLLAVRQAQAEGLPVWFARPFHCAVGTKAEA
jgi:SAM-dependent methyltransferase